MAGLYRSLLGHPFVYDHVRPRVVGGIDMRPLYDLLTADARRVVLDVGCGTGDALKYLTHFDGYLGIDTDPVAIDAARSRYATVPNVRFECRQLEESDVRDFAPTGVVLGGVLHHLTNEEAEEVLRLVAGSKRLVRIVTADIVFVPGRFFNNLLAMLDRGRHCRHPDGYAAIARHAGLDVLHGATVPSARGSERVQYHLMALAPRST